MDPIEAIKIILDSEEHERYDNEIYTRLYLENVSRIIKVFNKSKKKKEIIDFILNEDSFNLRTRLSYINFEFLLRIKRVEQSFNYLLRVLTLRGGRVQENITQPYYYLILNDCLGRLNRVLDSEGFTLLELTLIRDKMHILYSLYHKKKFIGEIGQMSAYPIEKNNCLKKEIMEKIDLKRRDFVDKFYDEEILIGEVKKVVTKVRKLSLGEEIALSFERLEKRYYEAVDNIDFSTYGGHIRTTLSELVKKIALKIADLLNEILQKKGDEDYRNYLEKKEVINEGINKLTKSFYTFLSGKINHRIATEREYYKRGFNIAFQLAYLLLNEYELFIKKGLKPQPSQPSL